MRLRYALLWLAVAAVCAGAPAHAQEEESPAAEATSPDDLKWIASTSAGALILSGSDTEPFVAAGVSRKLGRGYVRVSAITYRSAFTPMPTVMPSRFTIGSISGGGTFGMWFVDGYASYGRQTYGHIRTPLGTRASEVGSGSPVMGAGLSGGRFIALGNRWWLTASLGVQVSQNRALRQRFVPFRLVDYETRERAITGTGTLRVDRYFGRESQHIAGFSISRVQTSNGTVSIAGQPSAPTAAYSVPDGWTVAGASASFRLTPRLWLDAGVTRTIGAQSGNVTVPIIGLRVGF